MDGEQSLSPVPKSQIWHENEPKPKARGRTGIFCVVDERVGSSAKFRRSRIESRKQPGHHANGQVALRTVDCGTGHNRTLTTAEVHEHLPCLSSSTSMAVGERTSHLTCWKATNRRHRICRYSRATVLAQVTQSCRGNRCVGSWWWLTSSLVALEVPPPLRPPTWRVQ